jgi:hypothetical protein
VFKAFRWLRLGRQGSKGTRNDTYQNKCPIFFDEKPTCASPFINPVGNNQLAGNSFFAIKF